MSRIDAHQHFWSLARGDYDWPTPELAVLYRDFGPADLRQLLEESGICGTIAVQATPTVAETEFLLSLAAETPWIRGVIGWVDFDSPDVVIQIAQRARRRKFVGVRPMLQGIERPDWILDEHRAPGLEALAGAGLVFDALIKPVHLPHIETLAGRHEALSIVVDHGAKPPIGDRSVFRQWATGVATLAQRPNVSCKLSGLLTEAPVGAGVDALAPYVDTLISCFGPDRLIWGSDWPVLLLAGGYAQWSEMTDALLAGLQDHEILAIRSSTAQRVYKLSDWDSST